MRGSSSRSGSGDVVVVAFVLALGHRKSIGNILNGTKVGHADPTFHTFRGYYQISVLTPVLGLSISGIIRKSQVRFLSA